MENLNSENYSKDKKSNRHNDRGDQSYKSSGHKPRKHDKFLNKKFPFNQRTWVPEIEIEKDNKDYIRVISYNTLADSLVSISTQIAESDLEKYPYLLWENRRKGILAELKELNGDIICLQEFERDEDFIKEVGSLGYDCAFKPRTGQHSEGCAILWKREKFVVENLYCLEFNMNQNSKNISPIYDRDNVCLFAVLQYTLHPNMCFIVSNIHVLFNNNRGDVKLGQVYQTLSTLQILKAHYSSKYAESDISLIMCGDLNSIPNSGVYKMITEGGVNCTKLDKRKISGQREGSLEYLNANKFKSSLLNNVTPKFKEDIYKNNNFLENEQWFNDILRVESSIDKENEIIVLKYKDNYKYISSTGDPLILSPPVTLISAYAELLNKILNFFKTYKSDPKLAAMEPPFDSIQDLKTLNDIEVYGIKMGFEDIDKTLNFVKKLTLEPPFSFYGKGMMALVDYIFYNGNITPVRTLNIPDVNRVAFDIGYLPTEDFPSDHISLCVDFKITTKKE